MPELILDPQDGTPPLLLDWQAGFGVQPGPLGLGLPPRKLVEQVRGDGHGSQLVGTRTGPREVTIPLDVYGATRAEFVQRRRRLQVICGRSSHLRPVRVTYRDDNGVPEWIEGVYVGGLEGDEDRGNDRSELFAVVLRDGCPYWRAPRYTDEWKVPPLVKRPWFPLLGNSPAASVVGGRRTHHNPGDVEVRPPWLIQGPGSGLKVINHTAGWRVEVDYTIPASGPGSLLTLNTAFGEQSLRDDFGVNLFGRITNGARGGWEMGPLLPGDNDLEVRLDNPSGVSSVLLAYDPLLLAA